jgi:long-chain acyl-CoA synthetase
MEIKRVFDILDNLKAHSKKTDILNAKVSKVWKHYSVSEFVEQANAVSAGLLQIGLKEGDVVALMSNNRPEWNFVDYGAQQVKMPTAPIYPTIGNADLKFILNHCEAKIIFISDKNIFQRLAAMEGELPHLKYVVSFNPVEGVRSFEEFTELGKSNADLPQIENIKKSIGENDLITILYTSGTTGSPKGVMISHKNIISNVMAVRYLVEFREWWKALSFLPLNHVYERVLNTLYLYHGVSVYYAENFETIGDNAREIQPQVFVAVPRILERVLEKICAAGEKLTGFKKKIFDLSIRIAERYELNGANGFWYELQRKFCDILVYSKWRKALGGKVDTVVSGGAALNPRIERIFFCARIPLLQGYGLTETSVVISVNHGKEIKFGTVGPPVEKVEVKIAAEDGEILMRGPSDGEILMRGPSLMLGYYKNPQATAEVIDKDGWFHTGDVGTFIDGKYLKITDRKKELFKSSAGKYISPVAIENKLKESKFVEQCMVVGEGQKFVSAVIVPNMANFREHCEKNNIEWKGADAMLEHEELKNLINAHVKKINQEAAPFEQLKRVQFVSGPWTVESGEVTPKLSLKRKIIFEKYRNVIDKIFMAGE